jgi:hypothetical protein
MTVATATRLGPMKSSRRSAGGIGEGHVAEDARMKRMGAR